MKKKADAPTFAALLRATPAAMKNKADAIMLDELLRAHYKPLNLFTHKKFDTTDIRGFPFSDKKEKVKKMKKVKKVKNDNRVRGGMR